MLSILETIIYVLCLSHSTTAVRATVARPTLMKEHLTGGLLTVAEVHYPFVREHGFRNGRKGAGKPPQNYVLMHRQRD